MDKNSHFFVHSDDKQPENVVCLYTWYGVFDIVFLLFTPFLLLLSEHLLVEWWSPCWSKKKKAQDEFCWSPNILAPLQKFWSTVDLFYFGSPGTAECHKYDLSNLNNTLGKCFLAIPSSQSHQHNKWKKMTREKNKYSLWGRIGKNNLE